MDEKILRDLRAGAQMILENAIELCNEATLLTNAGALSRGLCLHQISLEECAKIEMLGWAASALLAGQAVDLKQVAARFGNHKHKNKVNAYFLGGSPRERDAATTAAAVGAFEMVQQRFHEKSNTEKNAALHVDWDGKTFRAPKEQITPKMVAKRGRLNERFLAMAAQKVDVLLRYERDPAKYRKRMLHIKSRMEALKAAKTKEVRKAFEALADELSAIS